MDMLLVEFWSWSL